MKKILSVMIFVASVSLAHAGPKEDAYQVVEKWGKAFADADVDGIANLYAPDALMIGTFGKQVLTKRLIPLSQVCLNVVFWAD